MGRREGKKEGRREAKNEGREGRKEARKEGRKEGTRKGTVNFPFGFRGAHGAQGRGDPRARGPLARRPWARGEPKSL